MSNAIKTGKSKLEEETVTEEDEVNAVVNPTEAKERNPKTQHRPHHPRSNPKLEL